MLSPRKTTWGILAACFLAFFVVSEAKAESLAIQTLTEAQVYQGIGICDTRNTAQSFTLATSTWLTKIEFYGLRSSGTSTIDIKLCMEPYNSCLHTTTLVNATSTLSWIEVDYGTEAEYLPAGTYWVYFDTTDQWSNVCPSTPWSIRSTNLSGVNTDYYPQGHATSSLGTVDADDDIAIRIYTAFDYEVVAEVIENPEYDPDLIVSVESEEAIDIAKYKECIIGEDCYWKFGYNSSYDDGTFYLIYDQEPRSRNYALDTVALGSKIIRSDRFEVPAATSTGIVNYCVFLENADAELELICGLQVKWYDEYESSAMAMQECISTACDDVSTSTASWWDVDFQGAIECGFRKTTCWLTTPSGAAKIRYREITGSSGQPGEVEQNFPLSVIAQFRSLFTAASVATTSTSTQYFAPIRVYDPTTGGMRTLAYMFNNKMLENGMGQYYDFYYDWATKILWLFFALYMFNRIYQVINPSAGSLFDLVLPGRKNEEASFDQVAHIDPIDLRKKYPKSNLTIDLRKKRF